MVQCQRSLTPLVTCVRHMAVGYNYKVSNKRCFYDPKRGDEAESTVKIPFKERIENMSRERKWQLGLVEDIFNNYQNIIAIHMKYQPRQEYEQKLDWDLVDELQGTTIQGNWYPRHCVMNYLRRSPYIHMLPLFQHRTGILYTHNEEEVQKICRILLKSQYKKHLILGGLVGGKLYGPTDLVRLGELEDKITEQSKLVGLLSTPGVTLTQTLSHTSSNLALVLQHRPSPNS